jgi:acyl-homoserine-lactone acylase
MSLRSSVLSVARSLGRLFTLRRLLRIVAGLLLVIGLLRVVHVWRRPKLPAPSAAAVAHAAHVTITRDRWGVPHIVGDSDADAAFGLAYAHAEDDFPTIQGALVAARGQLGRLRVSKDALINDYYVSLVRVHEQVDAQYESLEPATRAVLQGYAEGLNYYVAKHPQEADSRFLPYEGRDVARGFAHKLPFMVGVVTALQKLFTGQVRAVGDVTDVVAIAPTGVARTPATALGSNAHAVLRSRSSDDVTRLNVNSHQPWEGPVTWYEAHITSRQGWNMVGGVFPGSPLILHGHNATLGWAHTVNAPDLVDVYQLTMHPQKPLHYRYGDAWMPLTVKQAPLPIDTGLFEITLHRDVYFSQHGPVVKTDAGYFALRYAGHGGLIRASEQWFKMNKAQTLQQWQDAMRLLAIPMFNTVYADRDNAYYVYNALLPDRAPVADYTRVLPGDDPRLVWDRYLPFERLPQILNPQSGFVLSCNSTPFAATAGPENPKPDDFPATASIEREPTNRSLRTLKLLGGTEKLSRQDFLRMKWDRRYDPAAPIYPKLFAPLLQSYKPAGPAEAQALELLRGWDGGTDEDSVAASVATLAIRHIFYQHDLDGDHMLTKDPVEAFQRAVRFLVKHYGRVDVPLGTLQRLRHGSGRDAIDLPLGGGADILNAAYTKKQGGQLVGIQGDSYVMIVDFAADGPHSQSIHQYGASLRSGSRHYSDQAPLFVKRQLKETYFRPEDLAQNSEASYKP